MSLATSIQNIIDSINIVHGEITYLSQYRTRMRQHYATGLSKEEINNLQITKAQSYSKFIDPRTRQPPMMTKRRILYGLVYLPAMERQLEKEMVHGF